MTVRSAGKSEHAFDEADLFGDVALRQPSNLSFADHVHCFVALDGSFCTGQRAESLLGVHTPLDDSVILLQDVIQMLVFGLQGTADVSF